MLIENNDVKKNSSIRGMHQFYNHVLAIFCQHNILKKTKSTEENSIHCIMQYKVSSLKILFEILIHSHSQDFVLCLMRIPEKYYDKKQFSILRLMYVTKFRTNKCEENIK